MTRSLLEVDHATLKIFTPGLIRRGNSFGEPAALRPL